LVFGTLWVAGALDDVFQRSIASLPMGRARAVERDSRTASGAQYLALWPALTAVAVLAVPIFNAAIEADSVEAGRAVRQSDWLLPFAWDALAAIVSPSGAEAPGRCVIYLGNAGGFVAMYDPADGSSLRLPTSGTTVRTGGRLADVANVPGDCPSSAG
jgi:hypothetical protein